MLVRHYFLILAIALPLIVIGLSFIWAPILCLFLVLIPVIGLGLIDMFQTKHTIRRLYPFIGRFRYMLEAVRPEIQQYFVESDTSGAPVAREFRSLIYQRAKGARDSRPFGTIFDVNRSGYEWMNHSLMPKHIHDTDPRIEFGAGRCSQPYMASPLNISAMSYGSLSSSAVRALNKGAKMGGFWHNTGEGSISPYHLEAGGDLVWQIGTGYFGCRTDDGKFAPVLFKEAASGESVKMIEINTKGANG